MTDHTEMHAVAALWRVVFGHLTEIRKHRDAIDTAATGSEHDAAQIAYRSAADKMIDALLALQDIGATTVIPSGTNGGSNKRH